MLHALVDTIGALAVLASIVANVWAARVNGALKKPEDEAGASTPASASSGDFRSGRKPRTRSQPMCRRARRQ